MDSLNLVSYTEGGSDVTYSTSSSDCESTESDDGHWGEDYFLDVGFGDLMLTKLGSKESEAVVDNSAESLWCSNLDRFSNILRSSMSNLHATDLDVKVFSRLNSIDDEEHESKTVESVYTSNTPKTESETDDTVHQGIVVCSDNSTSKKGNDIRTSVSSMKHYYLSTNDLTMVD